MWISSPRGEAEALSGDPRLLIGEAADVDFDPPLRLVIKSHMLEAVDIDIAVELAVDAFEEVEIERRRDPGPIVVGGVEDLGVLFQIDADQHLSPGAEDARIIGKKRDRAVRIEIADRRSGEEPHPLAPGARQQGQHERPRIIGADGDHRDRRKILGESSSGITQMLARNVHRNIGGGPVERVQQNADLLAGAAAELDQPAMRTHLSRDFGGILFEDRDLGPRRIIFGQPADLFEEPGTARVVEEFARDRFAGADEPAEHGIAKALLAGRQIMKGKMGVAAPHQMSSASRSPAKAQRAEGGKNCDKWPADAPPG